MLKPCHLPPAAKAAPGAFRSAAAPLKQALVLLLALAVCLGAARTSFAQGDLLFGMSAAFSGPARGLGSEYCRGLLAGLQYANTTGGAGGSTFRLSLADDGYDPGPATGNTVRFVENEHVFGLLGYVGTPTTARVLPLLKRYQRTGMVLLFPLTGADMLRETPYDSFVYNLRPSYREETKALVEALLKSGRSRVAVFYQADIYGRDGWAGVRATLRTHGLSMVGEASYKRGASFTKDFRPEVALIAKSNPDAIITVGTAPACAAFVRDARAAGLDAAIATLSFADADNTVKFLLTQARVTGRDYTKSLYFSQVVPSYEDTSLPAVRLYRSVMDKARLQVVDSMLREQYLPQRYSFVSFEGFLASQVLTKAVTGIRGPVTPQALRRQLDSMHGLDIGIGELVHFAPGENQGLHRTYLTVHRDGRFQGVQGIDAAAPCCATGGR